MIDGGKCGNGPDFLGFFGLVLKFVDDLLCSLGVKFGERNGFCGEFLNFGLIGSKAFNF